MEDRTDLILNKLENLKEDFTELKSEQIVLKNTVIDLKQEIQNYKVRNEATIKTLKTVGAIMIAILTLKLGDVPSLVQKLFGA